MAVLSTLRSPAAKERLAQFAKTYSKHRPTVQRSLNIGFVVYTLGATYLSLTSRSAKPDDSAKKGRGRGKGKGTATDSTKPTKVAVRHTMNTA
jgi:ATP-binding cassette, subfamily D (ALD), peroxisomal long-chain fatty acid import protein